MLLPALGQVDCYQRHLVTIACPLCTQLHMLSNSIKQTPTRSLLDFEMSYGVSRWHSSSSTPFISPSCPSTGTFRTYSPHPLHMRAVASNTYRDRARLSTSFGPRLSLKIPADPCAAPAPRPQDAAICQSWLPWCLPQQPRQACWGGHQKHHCGIDLHSYATGLCELSLRPMCGSIDDRAAPCVVAFTAGSHICF
jgi:hypothetical protein